MSSRWLRARKKDAYYRLAKRHGYRSRAAYKLKQINSKFRVINTGDAVIDLGCSPGGWLQVASEEVGMDGLVIGIDLVSISPINGVIFIEGDATCQEVHAKVASILEEQRRTNVDAIISDMAPKLSGNRAFDQMRSYELCIGALNFARKFLKPGGSLVIKAFQGEMFRELLDAVRPEFKFCKSHSPRSSKARSAEIYIIAKGYNVTRSAGG